MRSGIETPAGAVDKIPAAEAPKVPTHVAIIMDGNGRWAAAQGRPRSWGHAQGMESIRACIKAARAAGVGYVTFYTFSTENWGRPESEVAALMDLLCEGIVKETPELAREGVRLMVIGSRGALSDKVRGHIEAIERDTAAGRALTVVLAINYSSRSEITRAAQQIASRALTGDLAPVMVTEKTLSDELYTADIPDPDLLIRTGGEQRLSNFLLWQAAYAELWFTPVMWPDFGEKEFNDALAEFAGRERRFGKVSY